MGSFDDKDIEQLLKIGLEKTKEHELEMQKNFES